MTWLEKRTPQRRCLWRVCRAVLQLTWGPWELDDDFYVRPSPVTPYLIIIRVWTRMMLCSPWMPRLESQIIASTWVLKVSAIFVLLRGSFSCEVCRCWCIAEVQVSKRWYPLLLAFRDWRTVQHSVYSIKTHWAWFKQIEWGLRTGRMEWRNG